MNATIHRPLYGRMTVADALAANWSGWHLSQKMDGVWAVRQFAGCVVTGEAMRDGKFYPFDILQAFGEDISRRPWTDRAAALSELFSKLPEKLNWHRIATGYGTEFIEAMIQSARRDNSPDVCVGKPVDGPFGWFVKIKILDSYDVTVTDTSRGKLSVAISFEGQDAGRVSVFNLGILENLNVGDVIEIAAGARLPSGKFREPRFIRLRPDKPATDCTIEEEITR